MIKYPTELIAHLWSLCVEEHAYVLLGILALLLKPSIKTAIRVTAAIALLAMLNGAIDTEVYHIAYIKVYWRTDVRVASILVSVAIYLLIRRSAILEWMTPHATALAIVTVMCGVVLNVDAIPDPIKYSLGTGCLAIAVALVDVSSRPVTELLKSPLLVGAGTWSYSLYLWQQPFYALSEEHAQMKPVALLGAIACGLASF